MRFYGIAETHNRHKQSTVTDESRFLRLFFCL